METRTIAVDFGKTDIYHKIEAGLSGLEIGVLGKSGFFQLLPTVVTYGTINVKDFNVVVLNRDVRDKDLS